MMLVRGVVWSGTGGSTGGITDRAASLWKGQGARTGGDQEEKDEKEVQEDQGIRRCRRGRRIRRIRRIRRGRRTKRRITGELPGLGSLLSLCKESHCSPPPLRVSPDCQTVTYEQELRAAATAEVLQPPKQQ